MRKLLCLFLLCLGACAEQQQADVNLFFTSDIEGVFWSRPEPLYGNEEIGGLAVLKSFLDKQTTPFVLLDGGNWFSQTPEGNLTKGDYFNNVSSSLPYSGRLFTEKDLVYGWGSLSHIIKGSSAPFILSNVALSSGKIPAGVRSWLMEDVQGIKIGIFGLVPQKSLRGKQRLGGLKISDEIEAALHSVALLKEKGAQVIVLLSALGASNEQDALTDAVLAEEVSGIDVIISSNLGREGAESHQIGKTLIVYPGSKLDSVAQVGLFLNKNKELTKVKFQDIVLYRRDFGMDSYVAELTEEVRRTTRNQMDRPVGKLEEVLTGNLEGESSLGNWAADCLRKWAKTDVAIVNADSLRKDMPAGTVTQYDLYQLYPYADHVTLLTMKGDSLLNALEEGLNTTGHFAQISGLQVRYSSSALPGKRIVGAWVKGNPISLKNTYRVAVTDYMLSGGAGHDGFIDSLEFKNTQVEMRTVLRLCLAGKNTEKAPILNRWRAVK